MMVQLTIRNSEIGERVITITKPDTFLFGRAQDAHVVLPQGDRFVSRNQFVLVVSNQECRLTDLDSANGTFVGRMRYGGRVPLPEGITAAPNGAREKELQDGDVINAGETMIVVRISREQPGAGRPTPAVAVVAKPSPPPTTQKAFMPPRETKVASEQELYRLHGIPYDLPGYRFERLIGEGQLGKVFKAVDEDTDEPVAIKVLSIGEQRMTETVMTALQRELAAQALLEHPNVVQFRFIQYSDNPCLIFEYVDGMNLRRFVEGNGGRLSLRAAAPIMLDVLAGLACAHKAVHEQSWQADTTSLPAIVHRDLKPDNILIYEEEGRLRAKVTDFGLVKALESVGLTGHTTCEVMSGTPGYWPREYITAHRFLYPASDVFSSAAVFFHVLAGDFARQGFGRLHDESRQTGRKIEMLEFVKVIMNEATRPLRSVAPEIPAEVARVIEKAMTERELPGDPTMIQEELGRLRYPDAGAFRDALKRSLQEVGLIRRSKKS